MDDADPVRDRGDDHRGDRWPLDNPGAVVQQDLRAQRNFRTFGESRRAAGRVAGRRARRQRPSGRRGYCAGRRHGIRHAARLRPTVMAVKPGGRKLIAQNRKARHDYAILDTYEAGIALTGTEVKSLRLGRASLVDGFATIDDGEIFLRNVHIPEYTEGSWTNHEPRRTRKLLLH